MQKCGRCYPKHKAWLTVNVVRGAFEEFGYGGLSPRNLDLQWLARLMRSKCQ